MVTTNEGVHTFGEGESQDIAHQIDDEICEDKDTQREAVLFAKVSKPALTPLTIQPIDYETELHRGFAFIEFELAEDASAAIDNMNDGEMFGRQLRVNLAKPMRNKEGGNRLLYFEL